MPIRILDFWKFKGIASSSIAFSQHTLNQLKRIHAYAKAVAFPLVFQRVLKTITSTKLMNHHTNE